jgi:hypothetical protein
MNNLQKTAPDPALSACYFPAWGQQIGAGKFDFAEHALNWLRFFVLSFCPWAGVTERPRIRSITMVIANKLLNKELASFFRFRRFGIQRPESFRHITRRQSATLSDRV